MNAAIRLVVHDDYAVFPVSPNKTPACPAGFKNAVREVDAVRDLWKRHPGTLVGLPCGAVNGVTVLDLDLQHQESRDWLMKKGGALPPGFTVSTRSGGQHRYFQHRPGVKCSASKIAKHVDVRSDGGYVVAWAAAGLLVLDNSPIPAWPDWLIPQTPPETPVQRDVVMPTEASLRGLIRTVAGAPDGQRNRILHWAACRCADAILAGAITEDAATTLLLHSAGAAGLKDLEAMRTIRSGLRGGRIG